MQAEGPRDAAPGSLSPGEHLRAEIERLRLDQLATAKVLALSRQTINNIVNDRQAVSRTVAIKLGRLFGQDADYWMRTSFPRPSRSAKQRYAKPLCPGVLVDHQLLQAVRHGLIVVAPFNERRVRAASIELTLGRVTPRPSERTRSAAKGHFTLQPGQIVSAATRERIELPHDHIGRAGALAKLAARGIHVLHALQIEPGFRGRIDFCILNTGRTGVTLKAGAPILAIEVSALPTGPARARARRGA